MINKLAKEIEDKRYIIETSTCTAWKVKVFTRFIIPKELGVIVAGLNGVNEALTFNNEICIMPAKMYTPDEILISVKKEIDNFLGLSDLKDFSINELKLKLKKSIEIEDYKESALLKREIEKRK